LGLSAFVDSFGGLLPQQDAKRPQSTSGQNRPRSLVMPDERLPKSRSINTFGTPQLAGHFLSVLEHCGKSA
jgi:hypothetical protein